MRDESDLALLLEDYFESGAARQDMEAIMLDSLHIYNITHKDKRTQRLAVTSIQAFDMYDARKKFEEGHGSGNLARKEIISVERVK